MGLLRRIRAILDKASPERDPRDVVIEQQDREIGRLRDDLARRSGRLDSRSTAALIVSRVEAELDGVVPTLSARRCTGARSRRLARA